jgi:hypothetical protein
VLHSNYIFYFTAAQVMFDVTDHPELSDFMRLSAYSTSAPFATARVDAAAPGLPSKPSQRRGAAVGAVGGWWWLVVRGRSGRRLLGPPGAALGASPGGARAGRRGRRGANGGSSSDAAPWNSNPQQALTALKR